MFFFPVSVALKRRVLNLCGLLLHDNTSFSHLEHCFCLLTFAINTWQWKSKWWFLQTFLLHYLLFEWLLFSCWCSKIPTSSKILPNTGASLTEKIVLVDIKCVNDCLFSIHPGRILSSALAVCGCCFLTSVAWCKLINIYSVNSANMFNRSLFSSLAEPGKLCFTKFLLLNHWFAIFVSDRICHFRMLIRRLTRLVWWLAPLLCETGTTSITFRFICSMLLVISVYRM